MYVVDQAIAADASKDEGGAPPVEGSVMTSVAEMPRFVRIAIRFAPRNWPKGWMLCSAIGQISTVLVMTGITQRLAAGVGIGLLFWFSGLSSLVEPALDKGVFLEMLLADRVRLRKMNNTAIKGIMSFVLVMGLVIFPASIYFFIVPLAATELLGPHTWWIVVIAFPISTVVFFGMFPSGLSNGILVDITRCWENEIQRYLKGVQEDLLLSLPLRIPIFGLERNTNILSADEESPRANTKTLVLRLNERQQSVETWARKVNAHMNSFFTAQLVALFIVICFCLIMIGISGGPSQNIQIMLFSIFGCLITSNWCQTLYTVAKPHIMWERKRLELLNGALVQTAKAQLGWGDTRVWNDWLHDHELNAARAFGAKVTMDRLRGAAGTVVSVFSLALYLVLREQLRGVI